jgi:hypothetical protein
MPAKEANFASAPEADTAIDYAEGIVVAPEPAKPQLGTPGRACPNGNNLSKRFATHSMPRHGEI